MPRMIWDNVSNLGGDNNPAVTAAPDAQVSFEKVYPTFNAGNWNFSYQNPYTPPPAAQPGYSTMPYQPYPQIQNSPPGGGMAGGSVGGGSSYGGAPAPAPSPRPIISEGDWLNSDSNYQDQTNQLNSALSDFLARLTKQRDNFKEDYNTSLAGLQRNQDRGMLNLGEDFTSRGLANSGLFAQARGQAEQGYTDQRNSANRAFERGNADFTTQEQDKRSSTTQALNNARSQSLARLAAQQAF